MKMLDLHLPGDKFSCKPRSLPPDSEMYAGCRIQVPLKHEFQATLDRQPTTIKTPKFLTKRLPTFIGTMENMKSTRFFL